VAALPQGYQSAELCNEIDTNDPSKDGGLVPARPIVEVALLELPADVVGRDVCIRIAHPTCWETFSKVVNLSVGRDPDW